MTTKQLPLRAASPTGSVAYQETLQESGRSVGGEVELRKQLDHLILTVGTHPGPARAYLGDGLTGSLWSKEDGTLLLQLSRTDGFPSVGEWERVTAAIPTGWAQIGNIEAGQSGDFYWMACGFVCWGRD